MRVVEPGMVVCGVPRALGTRRDAWRGAGSPRPGAASGSASLHRLHECTSCAGATDKLASSELVSWPQDLSQLTLLEGRDGCARVRAGAPALSDCRAHAIDARSPYVLQQTHRSNHGQTHTLHDHSPSHGCSPAPGTTFKKTDTSPSHGDRQHSTAHHPF